MGTATTPADCLDEEELRSLRSLMGDEAKAIDRGLEEDFRVLRSIAAGLQDADVLSSESWDWAEDMESVLLQSAETLGQQAVDIRRGAAALSRSPGEEAFVEALRGHAAFSDARRADAEEVAAALRRAQEKELRRMAAREHVADPAVPVFLGFVASETDSSLRRGEVPTPEELAVAAPVEHAAARMEGRMARLAGRLRRGAAAFAARPGEEALVAALQRQAANADAARATVEAFTASVRRFQAAGRSPPDGAAAGRARM
ncbi:hypothetical protein ACP70R_019692 [Stipagrostis hirtigluma subsp. patula]